MIPRHHLLCCQELPVELWSKQACPDRLIQPQLPAGGWVHQHAGGVLSLPDRKRGARGEQVLG